MQERRSIPAQSQREGAEGRFYQRYTHSPNPSSPLFYFGSGLSCELSLLAAPDIVVAADCPDKHSGPTANLERPFPCDGL